MNNTTACPYKQALQALIPVAYAVGVDLGALRWGFTNSAGAYKWHQRRDKLNDPRDDPRPRMRGELSELTPPAFRDVLLAMARSAAREHVAAQA